jgi:hypothetical protein
MKSPKLTKKISSVLYLCCNYKPSIDDCFKSLSNAQFVDRRRPAKNGAVFFEGFLVFHILDMKITTGHNLFLISCKSHLRLSKRDKPCGVPASFQRRRPWTEKSFGCTWWTQSCQQRLRRWWILRWALSYLRANLWSKHNRCMSKLTL